MKAFVRIAKMLGFEKPTGEKPIGARVRDASEKNNGSPLIASKPDGLAKQILNQLPNNFILNLTSKEKILMKKILLEEVR